MAAAETLRKQPDLRHFLQSRLDVVLRAAFSVLLMVAMVGSCQSSPAGKAAIDSPDPLHAGPVNLPPPQLGLPPDPMHSQKDEPKGFPVPKPPLSDEFWPCSQCHDPTDTVNRTRRELKDEHKNIKLHHDEENRWCLDCHDATNRDVLHLASGVTITFDESYRLCGQCHGDKFRDWKAGIHGKRTGMWNGAKEYLLCVHCHNPHSPHFKPLKPEAPPAHPEAIR
jgi:hypothetical protein